MKTNYVSLADRIHQASTQADLENMKYAIRRYDGASSLNALRQGKKRKENLTTNLAMAGAMGWLGLLRLNHNHKSRTWIYETI